MVNIDPCVVFADITSKLNSCTLQKYKITLITELLKQDFSTQS